MTRRNVTLIGATGVILGVAIPSAADSLPDQGDQDAEREEEHDIPPGIPHAEGAGARTSGQGCGRTGQRREIGPELDFRRCGFGRQTILVAAERDGGKAGQIDDEDQEQGFALER